MSDKSPELSASVDHTADSALMLVVYNLKQEAFYTS